MPSTDVSDVSSSDYEAAEREVEYDLEVEGSSDPSEHETSDYEPEDAYVYGSSAPSKGIGWRDIPSVRLSGLFQPKISHLSGVFPLFDLQKRTERGSVQESDKWPGVTSQITLFPDPF